MITTFFKLGIYKLNIRSCPQAHLEWYCRLQ